jgi:type II secretory pathway pseudopilin PulG
MNALTWGRRQRPRQARARRASGLTLIEMVLAIVVLGLVAASIATAFIAASDLVEKGRGRTELVQAGRAAMNRLLAELRTAVTIEARSDNYLRVSCSGTTDTGSFSRRVEFWAEDGTLWRRVEGEDKQVLAEHVQAFWTGGLTLWSTLDDAPSVMAPEVGPAGFFTNAPAWEAVRFGNGFSSMTSTSSCVSFPTGGVLNNARGTIEFWLKPDFSTEWIGLGQDKHLIDTADGGGRIELWFDGTTKMLTFEMNENPGLCLGWVPDWAPHSLVHIGLVWDSTGRDIDGSSTMALYVNGERFGERVVRLKWSPQAFGPYLLLGNEDGEETEAAFDNLRVYDYCKTDLRDRYLERAPSLMRVRLELADEETGDKFTIESGVMAQ